MKSVEPRELVKIDLGLIHFKDALAEQFRQVELLKGDPKHHNSVIFCSHPSIATKGSATQSADLGSWSGEVIAVQRGGRVTLHGPQQIIVYPIIDLTRAGERRPARDLGYFLKALERALINTLKLWQIPAVPGENVQVAAPEKASLTGVWVNNKKIAAIGIGVKSWITYQGLALNIEPHPEQNKVRPCGFSPELITSMSAELELNLPSRSEISQALFENLKHELG